MKAKDLISELQKLDPDEEVYMIGYDEIEHPVESVNPRDGKWQTFTTIGL